MREIDNESVVPVLLSLHERYFEEIKSGKKQFEYRKRYLHQPTLAYVYCKRPTKAIKGMIWFDIPIVGSPEEMSVISEKETSEGALTAAYFAGKEKGYAIPVLDWEEIASISLEELRERIAGFVPPQSYYRLDNKPELYQYLVSRTIENSTNKVINEY